MNFDDKIVSFMEQRISFDRIVDEMPDEYIGYITYLHDTPFAVETRQDRELVIYLYIVDLLKWRYTETDKTDDCTALFYALNSVYDNKPMYGAHRYIDE